MLPYLTALFVLFWR